MAIHAFKKIASKVKEERVGGFVIKDQSQRHSLFCTAQRLSSSRDTRRSIIGYLLAERRKKNKYFFDQLCLMMGTTEQRTKKWRRVHHQPRDTFPNFLAWHQLEGWCQMDIILV